MRQGEGICVRVMAHVVGESLGGQERVVKIALFNYRFEKVVKVSRSRRGAGRLKTEEMCKCWGKTMGKKTEKGC